MRRIALVTGLVLGVPARAQTPVGAPAPQAAHDTGTVSGVLFEQYGVRLVQLDLAVRADGALALVCVGAKGAILAATRAPGGDWSELRLVAEEPDLAVGMHRGPRIAWAGEALVVATISARFDRKARKVVGSGNLCVRRSLDGGGSWSEPLRVNGADGSAAEGLHALAARGERVVLVWLDPRGADRGMRVFAAESGDGGASFGPDRAVYDSPSGSICECCHPSLAFGSGEGGQCVVMWRNQVGGQRDMWLGALAPGADVLAQTRALGTGHWPLAACPMDGGDVALAADGRALAVWRRASEVFCSFGDAHEERLGPGKNPVVALAGTSALAVWENGRLLEGARLSLDESTPVPIQLGEGAYACAAALPDGSFLVLAERAENREGAESAGLACFELRAHD